MFEIPIFLTTFCCCGLCLVGLALLALGAFLIYALLPGKQSSASKPAPVKEKKPRPPPAPPFPPQRRLNPLRRDRVRVSPPSHPGLRFPGGAHEWEDLLKQVNLHLGETAETLADKGAAMVNFIQTLERAVFIPLWQVANSARYYTETRQLAEAHPAVAWRKNCQQALDDWQAFFDEKRTDCLSHGGENSAALECLLSGVVEWLPRLQTLDAELEALLAQETDAALAADLAKTRLPLGDLQRTQAALQKRDISWMANIPRTTFGNIKALQESFRRHFGPFSNANVLLPEIDILERRPGKVELNKTMAVEYAFGIEDGEEYLQFRVLSKIRQWSAARPQDVTITTNYRLYPSGKLVKYAPWVCEYCGMRLEDDSILCSECAYDEFTYLAWGKKDAQ